MAGWLIPPWYEVEEPFPASKRLVTFIWGFSIAVCIFIVTKGARQTYQMCHRIGTVNTYVVLIWVEFATSLSMSMVGWFYLTDVIEPSFWVFFAFWFCWVFQIQCLPQIIINRLSLLMTDKTRVRRMRWAVIVMVGLINISVAVVWIPARLQINPTFISVNKIWDRIEKVLFCMIDLSLNVYFLYLVKSRLIANGLTKYTALFRFNCCMVFVSISLDIILIGLMSLPDDIVYIQFHPTAYLIKLYIEMNMADLIRKVAKASTSIRCGISGGPTTLGPGGGSQPSFCRNFRTMISAQPPGATTAQAAGGGAGAGAGASRMSCASLESWGIHRTIETEVVRYEADGQKVVEEGGSEEEEEEEKEKGRGGKGREDSSPC